MSSRALVAAIGGLLGLTATGALVLSERDGSVVAGPLVAALVALVVLRFAPRSDSSD